jgi:hypothetical protein
LILRPALVSLTLVSVFACVGDSRPPSPTQTEPTTTTAPTTTAPPVSADAAVAAFNDCLVENGLVDEAVSLDAMGRPRLDKFLTDLDLTDPIVVGALTACSAHLTTGALELSDEPEIREAVLASLREFSECVRSRGVPDFPDPVESFNGMGAPYAMAEIPYTDQDLAEAVAECSGRVPGQ